MHLPSFLLQINKTHLFLAYKPFEEAKKNTQKQTDKQWQQPCHRLEGITINPNKPLRNQKPYRSRNQCTHSGTCNCRQCLDKYRIHNSEKRSGYSENHSFVGSFWGLSPNYGRVVCVVQSCPTALYCLPDSLLAVPCSPYPIKACLNRRLGDFTYRHLPLNYRKHHTKKFCWISQQHFHKRKSLSTLILLFCKSKTGR